MKTSLERISIRGLHGRKSIDAVFKDNLLILVGENGSGKTTFLRVLFHFLSGHWLSLIQFKFERIIATINGIEYKITHDDIVNAFRQTDRRLLASLPAIARKRVNDLILQGDIEKAAFEMRRFGIRYEFSESMIRDLFEESTKGGGSLRIQEIATKIRDAINAQILYLPTYRRIERELGSIFEGVDSDELRRGRGRSKPNGNDDAFIELVEFGMKDVQASIERTLGELKEFARENLNKLTLKYLGDVVNREYENFDMEFSAVSDSTVQLVLDRIDDSILSQNHKEHIFSVINSARSSAEPSEHEKIIYHYFLTLFHFQESLQQKEEDITAFCSLCSSYITDKLFIYDGATFSFKIQSAFESRNQEINPGDLSSGEKQIVSLFSHLYLSKHKSFYVLIDEPELSLSVPWQRRFLTDIYEGTHCVGLVAVTHSPFIYDNYLRSYAHSMGEFISE